MLLAHGDFDELDVLLVRHKARVPDIETGFLVDLANGTVQIILVFVDLASWETPIGAFLPTFDQDDFIHILVQQDGSAHGNTSLVSEKLGEGGNVMVMGPLRQQRTVLENAQGKRLQGQRGKRRIERSDEVFVEPLGFLDLEADPFD